MEDKTLNVLLVEDDEVDVMNVKRAFQKKNIKNPLYVASNGIEALKILRGEGDSYPVIPQQRRIILLDLNMPKMGQLGMLVENVSISIMFSIKNLTGFGRALCF